MRRGRRFRVSRRLSRRIFRRGFKKHRFTRLRGMRGGFRL